MKNEYFKIKTELNRKNWSEFVYEHPDGNIFQTPEIFEVYQETKNYKPILLAAIDNNENIVGLLLAVIQSELGGFIGCFTSRSIVLGGPLIKNNSPVVLECILKKYNEVIKRKAIYSQFRNMWEWSLLERDTFGENGFIFEEHLDIVHSLNTTENELWMKMKSKTRNKINKALKNGITIKILNLDDKKNIDNSIEIFKEVYKKAKLPLPDKTLFWGASKAMYEKKYLVAIGAFVDKKLIGTRWFLCYKDLVYDWYAGSLNSYLNYRPNDLLPWEEIKWSNESGFKYFDFGGAGKPNIHYGVRDYKKKFGGKLVSNGRFVKIHMPLLMKLGKFGLNIYKMIK